MMVVLTLMMLSMLLCSVVNDNAAENEEDCRPTANNETIGCA